MIPLDAHLLAAVLDDPDNDALRLVCADWWEDQGETERAEFVRIQVEMEHTTICECEPRGLLPGTEFEPCHWCGLWRREQELSWCCRAWARDLHLAGVPWFIDYRGEQPKGSPPRALFRRGFIAAVKMTATDWLAHADAIRAQNPVQAVTLTTWPQCSQPHGFRNPCCRFDETARIFPWCDACRLTIEESRAKRWPGVTFTLPPQPGHGQSFGTMSFQTIALDT